MTLPEAFQYLSERMEEIFSAFTWDIKYNPGQMLYEVYVLIEVEDLSPSNPDSYKLMDYTGRVNRDDCLLFSDRIAFYDPEKAVIENEFYLTSFPYDSSLGIEKGLLDAFARYSNQVFTEGKRSLYEFLAQADSDSTFSVSWNEENFFQLIQTLKDTQRYDLERLSVQVAHDD